MSAPDAGRRDPDSVVPFEPQYLDGHTIESLSDYLDRGRQPRDPSIESSSQAQHALAALSRLRSFAPKLLVAEAKNHTSKNDHWIQRILDQIGVQTHAGRSIPFSSDQEGAILSISEGAARALIRQAGDDLDGVLVERVKFGGDIETRGADTSVSIEVSTRAGVDGDQVSERLRRDVRSTLERHTELRVTEIDVSIRDADLTEEDER